MLIKTSRREWLRSAAYGLGGYAVSGMMPGGGWFGVPDANAVDFRRSAGAQAAAFRAQDESP